MYCYINSVRVQRPKYLDLTDIFQKQFPKKISFLYVIWNYHVDVT